MAIILNKVLQNNCLSIGADCSFFLKFDQNSFKLIDLYSSEKIEFNFIHLNSKINTLDFSELEKLIIAEYNFASSITNSFAVGNSQYYLLTLTRNKKSFNDQEIKIHQNFTELLKDLNSVNPATKENSVANQDFFHLFAEDSNEMLFTLDSHGVFTFLNEYALKHLKYNSEEIIGKHFLEIISDDFKIKAAEEFQKILDEQSKIIFDAELIPKMGIEKLFNLKIIPINNGEKINLLLGIGNNISEQNIHKKRIEELLSKLKEANRLNSIERDRAKQQISILSELNDLKNEFISNVSHELRTPLASIIGFSETIIEDESLTVDRAKEFNDVILTESKRLAKLINDVLDFSELENEKQQLQKSSNNIISILKDCLTNFEDQCKEKKITLTNNVPDSEITIFGDEERLKKAFSHLLANAVKFTPENGRITLIAKEFLKEVEIVISDTGLGISEQKLPLLFDKFSKVKRSGNNLPGAGFGLVTVKQIIDLHKGLIRVRSEVDKGTSFIIRLPKYSFN